MGNTLAAPNDPVTNKSTNRGYSQAQEIKYAASGMKGLRATMEDQHIFTNEITVTGTNEVLTDHSLFAVFDGHGGDFTSKYAAKNFIRVLSNRIEMKKYAKLRKLGNESRSDVTGFNLLKSALQGAFFDLDKEIRPLQEKLNKDSVNNFGNLNQDDFKTVEHYTQIAEHSGSTCVVVVLTPSHIIGCNAGDSRAILRSGGKVLPLSFDHKPSEISERERITEAGGFVKGKRIDGDLAVSRALGDFLYKNTSSLPIEKQKVICKPDVLVYPRSELEDEFIVLACDGVWDVASSAQCAEFVQTLLLEGELDLGVICEEALDTCLERNSRDNMTIMIIGLPGMQTVRSHVAIQNAVWGRRTARRTKDLSKQARKFAEQVGTKCGIQKNYAEATQNKITAGSESRFSEDLNDQLNRLGKVVPAM